MNAQQGNIKIHKNDESRTETCDVYPDSGAPCLAGD